MHLENHPYFQTLISRTVNGPETYFSCLSLWYFYDVKTHPRILDFLLVMLCGWYQYLEPFLASSNGEGWERLKSHVWWQLKSDFIGLNWDYCTDLTLYNISNPILANISRPNWLLILNRDWLLKMDFLSSLQKWSILNNIQ